jgi:hypothetical protein
MLNIKAINPAFLDSSDVNHDAFRECESNREIVLIKCPSCAHLMAWCCECDTLFPDLRNPQLSFGVGMTDSRRDRVECFRCHKRFPDFYFLRSPFIGQYLVTRAEIMEAGLEGLLA